MDMKKTPCPQQTLSTEERFENALQHQPDRYIVERDECGQLTEVMDKDSGRLWKKVTDGNEEGWIWID